MTLRKSTNRQQYVCVRRGDVQVEPFRIFIASGVGGQIRFQNPRPPQTQTLCTRRKENQHRDK
jgi:hypothetical protein